MESITPEASIESLLQPFIEGTDMFVTTIRIKPTNNIKIFLDADSGLDISKCASISRRLYHAIEDQGLYPDGNFSLEVSSHGVDEPLSSVRQYTKNIGRTVEVTPMEGDPVMGILKEVGEDQLVITVKGIKKAPATEVEIPFASIKSVVVQVVF